MICNWKRIGSGTSPLLQRGYAGRDMRKRDAGSASAQPSQRRYAKWRELAGNNWHVLQCILGHAVHTPSFAGLGFRTKRSSVPDKQNAWRMPQ